MRPIRQHQATQERIAFLASPTAWSTYFIVVYLLVELACGIGLLRRAVEALTLILMLPTLAVIIYAGLRERSGQKQATQSDIDPASEVDVRQMQHFAGEVGIWLSGLFVLLTLAVGAAALVLQPC